VIRFSERGFHEGRKVAWEEGARISGTAVNAQDERGKEAYSGSILVKERGRRQQRLRRGKEGFALVRGDERNRVTAMGMGVG